MQAMKEQIDKLQKQQQQEPPSYDLSLPVSHSIEVFGDNGIDEDASTSRFWSNAGTLARGDTIKT